MLRRIFIIYSINNVPSLQIFLTINPYIFLDGTHTAGKIEEYFLPSFCMLFDGDDDETKDVPKKDDQNEESETPGPAGGQYDLPGGQGYGEGGDHVERR